MMVRVPSVSTGEIKNSYGHGFCIECIPYKGERTINYSFGGYLGFRYAPLRFEINESMHFSLLTGLNVIITGSKYDYSVNSYEDSFFGNYKTISYLPAVPIGFNVANTNYGFEIAASLNIAYYSSRWMTVITHGYDTSEPIHEIPYGNGHVELLPTILNLELGYAISDKVSVNCNYWSPFMFLTPIYAKAERRTYPIGGTIPFRFYHQFSIGLTYKILEHEK